MLMLKILVLQKYYGLSDGETALQIMDRLSFMEFLGLRPGDSVSDRTTIGRFKERFGPKGLKGLFKRF